ncbi:hypothetical protein F4808DRAFT_203539 [Astrocystis sublimbata]|nr:hypothetical protein F4808DRAFT_203539 [Astrocystis sublimbata]
MKPYITFPLGILLATSLSQTGVFAAPKQDFMLSSEGDTVDDRFRDPVSSSSFSAVLVAQAMVAQGSMVSVTVTTIETSIINPLSVFNAPTGSLNTTTNPNTTTVDKHGAVIGTYDAESGTGEDRPLDKTLLSHPTITPIRSTPSLHQAATTHRALRTSTTTMYLGASSPPTSTFDGTGCDDVFCNTDGNKVCMHWGGMTSWDISLGPRPGEQPTVIGTC